MHAQREIINRALWNMVGGMKDNIVVSSTELRKNFPKLSDDEFAVIVKMMVAMIDTAYNRGAPTFMRSVDAALER